MKIFLDLDTINLSMNIAKYGFDFFFLCQPTSLLYHLCINSQYFRPFFRQLSFPVEKSG